MLDNSKLKHVHRLRDKTVAQCPACAAAGMDQHGNHLVVFPDGRYGCVANPGDHDHRKRIWQLVGLKGVIPPSTGLITFRHPAPIQIIREINLSLSPAPTPTDTSDAYLSLRVQNSVKEDIDKYKMYRGGGQQASAASGGVMGSLPSVVHAKPSEASVVEVSSNVAPSCSEPSEASEPDESAAAIDELTDMVAAAWGPVGKVTRVTPADYIPARFLGAIATWSVTRNDAAWARHPQVLGYKSPQPVVTRLFQPPRSPNDDAWIKVAQIILSQESSARPIDEPTRRAMLIGLKALPHQVCAAAVQVLEGPDQLLPRTGQVSAQHPPEELPLII